MQSSNRMNQFGVCLLLVMVIMLVTGCEMVVGELLEGSLSEREMNSISKFDPTSFFPIIEGYQWTSDDGTTIRVENVDCAVGTFEMVNTDTGEREEGSLGFDAYGAYIRGFFEHPIMHHGYFTFQPLIYEDDVLIPGFSWTYALNSNGYSIEQEMEITGTGIDITTLGGQEYVDCLEMTRTINYPEGYDWDPRIDEVVYYLKRGVGFVQEVRYWSDASTETHYMVSHLEVSAVTYDANGADTGSVPVDNGVYLPGQEAEVLGNSGGLGRIGYCFNGWNTEADGSGTAYEPEDSVTIPDGDMVLYAQWGIDTYMIGYVLNGGVNASENPVTYTIEDNEIVLAEPVMAGYEFAGWYGDSSFTIEVTGIPAGSTGDMVLYAQWTIISGIGERGPAGGYIFYDDEADGVDDIPGYRYLEAAPYGWYNGGADPHFEWGAYGYTVSPSATGTGVGTGKANTENIVSFHDSLGSLYVMGDYYTNSTYYYEYNDGSVAAKVCTEYSVTVDGTVYDDWFLPSKDELNLIYENLHLQGLGGFSSYDYWSSSEYSSSHAWKQYFYNGYQDYDAKDGEGDVRAVRAF